ncbi:PREDICTED: ubiquilin-4-like [Phaethon lepturus]|uniref:ubiquilin-4-like n=1 Tax=Phaethon lepturus TaxID=97097 RepID=UPI0005308CB6|nr:PREDICTED: ubiquilin-4-like [Phaethon lepturus]
MSKSKGAAETSQSVVTMESSNIIKVTVKTLKQKEQFEVAQSSTIQEFKEDVAKRFKTPPDLLVLIFAGKVLKDQDTLSQHGVHSGVSIHVVIRSQKRPQDGLADQRREIVAQTMENLLSRILSSGLDLNTINNNAFLLGFLLGVTGVHLLSLDSTDMLDLVSSIPEQDVSMHSLISEMMQSTFVQNVLDNADVVRDLIMSNPQMQQLAEENPEIGHILTNPHTIREILEASSSPAIMQELIRNRDVAMNNLESIPGGYRALEQLYREIEEPILDAVQAQLGNNPFAPLDSNPSLSGARLPAHTENRRPLPNPWAPRSNRASDNTDDSDGQFASSGFASAQQLPPEMENAEVSSLLRNPRALQALLRIQLGLQTLSTEVPDFILSLEDSHVELDLESMDDSTQSSESEDDVILMSDEDEAEGQAEMDEETPQTRFKRQMEQLSAMGFQDQSANLQALIDAEGEINAAVEILAKAPSSNKIP